MRTNLILFILLFLTSCNGDGSIKTAKEYHTDLVIYEDFENKVICYSILGHSNGGLSCVKRD